MKLHKSSSSIGVIKKYSCLNVILKLSTLQGKISNKNERHGAKRNLLISHLAKDINELKQLLLKSHNMANVLKSSIGLLLFNMLCSNTLRTIRAMRVSLFKTKNKNLTARNNTPKHKINAYDAPVTNLSAIELSD